MEEPNLLDTKENIITNSILDVHNGIVEKMSFNKFEKGKIYVKNIFEYENNLFEFNRMLVIKNKSLYLTEHIPGLLSIGNSNFSINEIFESCKNTFSDNILLRYGVIVIIVSLIPSILSSF
jgi:hypothetical protein